MAIADEGEINATRRHSRRVSLNGSAGKLHPRASVQTARRAIEQRHKKLRLPAIDVTVQRRTITMTKHDEAWREAARPDGCYCMKTDLLKEQASKETVHDRYKDVSQVEWDFRTSKTMFLEARPIHVCLESRTRGHLLVVMLAYLLVQELATCWRDLDLTVEEDLAELKSLCTMAGDRQRPFGAAQYPKTTAQCSSVLDAAHVTLPHSLVDRGVQVPTRRKLTGQRTTA
ncbi:MAG: hypothetical protein ACOC7K_01210 [bacterium]